MIQAVPPKARAIVMCLSWGVFSTLSPGQSAEAVAPSPKEGGKDVKKNVPAPKPVDELPSRFAGKDIGAYALARAAVFSMSQRETDPFGLNQDPSVKPVVKRVSNQLPQKRLAALPPTPLADIVRLIRVTTIMPREKKFLVGVREFSEFDEFPLVYQSKRIRMKITEVSATRIVFTNLDNGETATLETGMLPPGMVVGKEALQPAGMVSPVDDLPLDLGSPNAELPNN